MYPVPAREPDRLADLRGLAIVGTAPETHLDAVCRLACDLFAVPVATITFIEAHRQWHKAACGLDSDGGPRESALCAHTIMSDEPLVVPDATADPRFADNPLVTGAPGIRFYAGVPLALRPGLQLGTLCLIDTVPRVLLPEQMRRLQDLAAVVVAHLRLHEMAVSERTREAEAARVDAEQASAAKSAFLAAMSHEIRTPLNGVIGYSDLLCEQPDLSPDARLCAERIRCAGSALLTVVNDVLEFSKLEAGQVEIVTRPFAPMRLIEDAVSIVRGLAEAKGLTLAITPSPVLPSWLLGDEDRLRQVILNLLNNAVKFTTRGRIDLIVEARVVEGAAHLRIGVRDTGIGVPADKRDRLFRRFSQVDGSISRDHGGTGLGLAISKALVERMGGTIGCETREGQGSTFWFTLELPVAADPVPAIEPPSASLGLRTPLHLLLAEDAPLNQELACAILERAGHTVDVVDDGAAAVAAVRANTYDLVLMDLQMPVLDGLAAARHIRELDGAAAQVPILALTANVLSEQVAGIRTAGMDGYIGKPFRARELLDVIDRTVSDAEASQTSQAEKLRPRPASSGPPSRRRPAPRSSVSASPAHRP